MNKVTTRDQWMSNFLGCYFRRMVFGIFCSFRDKPKIIILPGLFSCGCCLVLVQGSQQIWQFPVVMSVFFFRYIIALAAWWKLVFPVISYSIYLAVRWLNNLEMHRWSCDWLVACYTCFQRPGCGWESSRRVKKSCIERKICQWCNRHLSIQLIVNVIDNLLYERIWMSKELTWLYGHTSL